MNTKLLVRFQQEIRQFHLSGKPVLLAVSGGMDSMAMAHLFLKSGKNFGVGHCNFQLRGMESEADENHVKTWCIQNNIPFYSARFDTEKFVAEWKKGIQETARFLRYGWLEKTRDENGYSYIATAHHANDNAETLLMHLFKGCGMAGLHGIPTQNGKIIRPLLFATREMISDYVKEYAIEFREDVSNASDKYLRNAVRHQLVPVIESLFPDAVARMQENIERFSQAEMLYKMAVDKIIKNLSEQRGHDIYIPVLKLKKTKPLETVCYELFHPFGFTSLQTQEIVSLINSESGHYISSASHKIIKDRDFLILTKNESLLSDFILVEKIPGKVEAGKFQFHFRKIPVPGELNMDADAAMIDIAKLEMPLILRKWKTADYFYPLGMKMKKKKLSRFFIDQKIPLHEKEQVWILESNKKIVWVCGLRLDERFKVTGTTQEVLQVSMMPKKADA